jgi:hypothetical protein
MGFRLLADATVVLHLAFVVFVILGGLLVLRWPRVAWVHVPAAGWGAWVELAGWVCPLTPVENWLRIRGSQSPYGGSFVEAYVLRLLYPASLTAEVQWALGVLVIAINALIYTRVARRRRKGA